MHKNIEVVNIELDETTGSILNVKNQISIEHLPVGVHLKNGVINRSELNHWWHYRSIPASRAGIDELLRSMNIFTPKKLMTHCMGLSLSDQYWIKPANSDLRWEDINFFENPFSEDMGNLLFGDIEPDASLNLCSPDNTLDGELRKRWKIIDGKRCLIKAGVEPFYQQPINEVIASNIMQRLDIPHVNYNLIWRKNKPFSVCEDFVTPDTELVSAHRVMEIKFRANHQNEYMHFTSLCEENGISDIKHSMDQMIVLDYIIANEDRHFNNFGIIRNADTLEWLGAAPVFDSGSSLAYKRPAHLLNDDIMCKTFKRTHSEQLGLVTSFDWIDFSKLKGIEDEVSEIMSTPQAKAVLGETRHTDISDFLKKRIERLDEIVASKTKQKTKIIGHDFENIVAKKHHNLTESSIDCFTENVHIISNDTICGNADALLDLYTLSKQESVSNLAIFNKAHDNDMEFGSFAVFKDINSRAELKCAYDKLSCDTEKPSFDEVYEHINTFIQPFTDKDYEQLSWSPTKSIWERQIDGPDKKSSETKLPPPPPLPPFPPTSSEESSTNNEADTNKPKKDDTSSNHLSAKTILLNETARGAMFPNIKTTTHSDDFTNPYNN